MRDPRREKRLDLRQAHLKGMSPSLWGMFEQLNPEYSLKTCGWRERERIRDDDRSFFDQSTNIQYQWIRKVTGMDYTYSRWCHPPCWARREIEKKRRAKVGVAMRKINAGDYDTHVPTFRKDVRWWC